MPLQNLWSIGCGAVLEWEEQVAQVLEWEEERVAQAGGSGSGNVYPKFADHALIGVENRFAGID